MAEGLLMAHAGGRHCPHAGAQVSASTSREVVMQGVNNLDTGSAQQGQRLLGCVWCCLGFTNAMRMEVPREPGLEAGLQ